MSANAGSNGERLATRKRYGRTRAQQPKYLQDEQGTYPSFSDGQLYSCEVVKDAGRTMESCCSVSITRDIPRPEFNPPSLGWPHLARWSRTSMVFLFQP